MTTNNAEPTAPEPYDDGKPTRRIVLELREIEQRRAGSTTVWRIVGAAAFSLATAIGVGALARVEAVAVDHEIVVRHERELDSTRVSLAAINAELAAQTAILERVERRLDRSTP